MARLSSSDCISLDEATSLASKFFNSSALQVLDFHVKAFASEKLGFLADHKLLSIRVRRHNDKDDSVCSFFLKAPFDNCNDFDRLVFQEEKDFYGDALPKLLAHFNGEAWAAKCYLVKDNLLVLEDLRARQFRSAAVSKGLSAEQLETAITSVARFHACSMIMQAHQPKALTRRFKEKTYLDDDHGFAWKWLQAGVRLAESVAEDLGLDSQRLSLAYEMMLRQIQQVDEHEVLCHEDLWCNNIMFSEDGDSCRLVDFQMVVNASFAVDLLQLIHLNCDRTMRQRLEPKLLAVYHSIVDRTLAEHALDNTLSLDKVLKTVEDKRICGLVMAVQVFPISMLNAQMAKEYSQDQAIFNYNSYTCRKDFVKKAMRLDPYYKRKIQESVIELVQFMQQFQDTSSDIVAI